MNLKDNGDSISSSGPLAGLRVVECGQLIAGPFVGQLLGDLGADVVKIEAPNQGDPMRQWGRELPEGESLWWSILGRNKRTVAIDLRQAQGQELARSLIAKADVVIENFRPGTFERWGLDYETLSAVNPALIMVRVSGYGQTGPYSARAGYGAIGEAMGGLRYLTGDPNLPPSRVGISIGDSLAALFATIGVLAALHERTSSGRGQVIDSAIYEAVLAVTESLVPEWSVAGYQRERSGSILPRIAPSNAYPTADGGWILIAGNQDSVFKRLAEAIGQPDLATSEKFSTHNARGENQTELDEIVADFTRTKSTDEIEELMDTFAVPCGRIFTVQDMLSDAQFRDRESIVEVPHDLFGNVAMQNVFPRLSRTVGKIRWVGQELGAFTDEVLAEIGLTTESITTLRQQGIIQ